MKKRLLSILLTCAMTFTGTFSVGIYSFAEASPAQAEETERLMDETESQTDLSWELIKDAYIYTFPLMLVYATKEKMTNTVSPTSTQAPVNQFIHASALATASATNVVTPNVDTVYSQVWLDLSEDAVVLEKPSTDRFVSFQVMDAYTNSVVMLGTGGDTTDAATYLFTGPSYEGEVPEGMIQISMPTNMGWIICRTVCDGTEDLENVAAIQQNMHVSTLNQYQTGAEPAQGTYDESKNYTPLNYILSLNPVEYFTLANQLMVENPPAAEDADAIAAMAAINVGPGLEFNPAVLGENASENWISMLSGMTAMLTASTQGFLVQNGIWSCYGSPIGEYGTEYNYRALVALGGLGANPLSVAMYLKTTTDSEGNRLSGDHTYVLHFDADQLPPVEEYGFWSITAYNSENNLLIDNVLDR